jgi:hypothetical protein
MKYYIVSEAGLALDCYCVSDMYLALETNSPSPMEGSPVESWRREVKARDSAGLKSQFICSAKHPVRDGAAWDP